MDSSNINEVIRNYLDACYESNVEKFRQVLHSSINLYKNDGAGGLMTIPFEGFIEIIESSYKSSPTPNFPKQDEIVSIDYSDDDTAVARVKVRVGKIMFSDILSLLRLDGKWMIVSKVFAGKPID